jgi:hypothetical protein
MGIVLILCAACTPETGDRPGETTTTERSVLPDPDIAVSVYSTPGDGQSGTWVPDFQMRRDGTVFVNGVNRFGIDRYQLSAAGVARVRDLVSGISTDADTYGEVEWTDQGTTGIYINLDGEPRDVDIYGLRGITDPDDLHGDVSGRQAEARAPYTPDTFYLAHPLEVYAAVPIIEGSGRRPSGWRARVDLAAGHITEAEVDP